jgi:hypothetical protein
MWNPPWTLSLVMPFGMLPYPAGRLLWFAVHLGIIVGSIVALWKFYGGKSPHWLIVVGLVVGFPPAVNALGEGQISAFVLLGLIGFLYFQRGGQEFLAGTCAALALVKPHLLLLFWCALFLRSLHQRRFTALFGAATSVGLLSAIALAANPQVFQEYFHAVRSNPPYYWVPPTFGALLRMTMGWDKTWLSFLPSAGGLLWVAVYCYRHRGDWSWSDQMGPILLISVMTTAYGWVFDQIVFLIPIAHAAALVNQRVRWPRWTAWLFAATCLFGFFVTAYQTSLVAEFAEGVDTSRVRELAMGVPNSFWFIIVPPVLLVAYLGALRTRGGQWSGPPGSMRTLVTRRAS